MYWYALDNLGANLIKKEGVKKFPNSALLTNVIYLNLRI